MRGLHSMVVMADMLIFKISLEPRGPCRQAVERCEDNDFSDSSRAALAATADRASAVSSQYALANPED